MTNYQLNQNDLFLYTDGSKNNEKVGAGVVIYYKDKTIYQGYFQLGKDCSITQAVICNQKRT